MSLFGLLSALLAAINQLLRLREWHEEESQDEKQQEITEELDAIKTRLDSLSKELARLETLRNVEKQ